MPTNSTGYLSNVKWRFRDILIVFIVGSVGSALVANRVIASGAFFLDPLPFALISISTAVFSLIVVWYLSWANGSGSLEDDVGLVVRSSDWWGVFAGMGLQIAVAMATAPLIVWFWPEGPPTQEAAGVAGYSETLFEQLAVLTAIAVVAPIFEEVIFRGMLLSLLCRFMNKWPAILVSAGIFSALHLVDPGAVAVVPGLFLVGVVLGWVAIQRGDLSLAIAMHSGVNMLAAIAILYGDSILKWSVEQMDELNGLAAIILFF